MKYVRGVEYLCDCVRPTDLPRYAEIVGITAAGYCGHPEIASKCVWSVISKFRIVDTRPEFDPELVVVEWYDYASGKQLANPPTDTVVEIFMGHSWYKCLVIGYHNDKPVITLTGSNNTNVNNYQRLETYKARPLN